MNIYGGFAAGKSAAKAFDAALSEREIEVVVRVRVNAEGDPKALAVEMVKDALARRAPRWQHNTFVSESDVFAR